MEKRSPVAAIFDDLADIISICLAIIICVLMHVFEDINSSEWMRFLAIRRKDLIRDCSSSGALLMRECVGFLPVRMPASRWGSNLVNSSVPHKSQHLLV